MRTSAPASLAPVLDSGVAAAQEFFGRSFAEPFTVDERHVQGIVTHELVHVFHGQNNPTGDFVGADDVGWFVEGLAVYAPGQLAEGHSASAAEAVERGLAPAHLSEARSGQYRNGVCGSLVEFMETRMGRDELTWALAATGNDELLASLGMSEAEFFEARQAYVRGADD